MTTYPDSHSPWSQWLTDQLLDREWTSSGLVEASGHAFDLKQVSRWLHSQDVPEPWAAVLVAKAFGASVAEALRAAEHGVVVDAVLEEAEQQDERDACGVQLPADSAARLGASPDTRCARPAGHAAHDDGNGVLWVGKLRAEQDERDGDVRAVAALRDALRAGGRGWGEADALIERFADRIAALEARDAKAGDQ